MNIIIQFFEVICCGIVGGVIAFGIARLLKRV
jgi:hypothetical protein